MPDSGVNISVFSFYISTLKNKTNPPKHKPVLGASEGRMGRQFHLGTSPYWLKSQNCSLRSGLKQTALETGNRLNLLQLLLR